MVVLIIVRTTGIYNLNLILTPISSTCDSTATLFSLDLGISLMKNISNLKAKDFNIEWKEYSML